MVCGPSAALIVVLLLVEALNPTASQILFQPRLIPYPDYPASNMYM